MSEDLNEFEPTDHIGSPMPDPYMTRIDDPEDMLWSNKVEEPPKRDSFLRWLIETLIMVALAYALAMGSKAYIAQPFMIPTGSMQSTLEIGDRVFYNKIIYLIAEPEPGDIVVFDNPTPGGTTLTKRVIAVGGQTIDIRDGYVYIDGVALQEPYIEEGHRDDYSLAGAVTIPEGYAWLMGDNRANSGDSRIFGFQPIENIHGRAFMIYWPLDHFTFLSAD